MADMTDFTNFPSPPNSMYYVYGADSEPYLSEPNSSPNHSTVRLPRINDWMLKLALTHNVHSTT
jgi:hypothetical protein